MVGLQVCICFCYYHHLWSLSLNNRKTPNSKAIIHCWLFSFCILFTLGNGNNLAHFSFYIIFSYVCCQLSVRFTCPSTVEHYQSDKHGREMITIKERHSQGHRPPCLFCVCTSLNTNKNSQNLGINSRFCSTLYLGE